jgi:hypothetical protein
MEVLPFSSVIQDSFTKLCVKPIIFVSSQFLTRQYSKRSKIFSKLRALCLYSLGRLSLQIFSEMLATFEDNHVQEIDFTSKLYTRGVELDQSQII